MPSSRALRWLHWVGYVTTAVVVVELALLGTLFAQSALREQRMRASIREETRAHDGPLMKTRYGSAFDLLSKLPPPTTPASGPVESVSLTIAPAFAPTWCAVSITAGPQGATARIVLVDARERPADKVLVQRDVPVPLATFNRIADKVDRQMTGWPGDSSVGTDGTAVGFELRRRGRIMSGEAGSEHYAALAASLHDDLASFAPEMAQPGARWCVAPAKP